MNVNETHKKLINIILRRNMYFQHLRNPKLVFQKLVLV